MSSRVTPIIESLSTAFDITALTRAYPDRWRFLLHSAGGGHHSAARWSIAFRQTGKALMARCAHGSDFFEQLDACLATSQPEGVRSELPFLGGWFVYLGYEMAAAIEPQLDLPAAGDGIPVAYAAECGCALIHDHHLNQRWLVTESEDWRAQVKGELDALDQGRVREGESQDWEALAWQQAVDSPARFLQGVERIKSYIRAGDVFQVNLSRQWTLSAHGKVSPLAVFDRLMGSNPAPFSGLAHLPGGSVLSTSPERLIERRQDRIQTRPIAGTRPRGGSSCQDMALMEELNENLKERAEHVMLIDLERNDLGRVCVPGSVEVDELMGLESYAHVHHIVSNVAGQLRPNATSVDALRAVFPGGTITGCPKVRCMEIIAELEGAGRGAYTGAMGYIDFYQNMDMNILIRTASLNSDGIRFRAGAGIVADSDPHAELRETEAKAKGLLAAFGVHV